MNKRVLFAFAMAIMSTTSWAQCPNHVEHLEGTATVNGVDVTVTSEGFVDWNSGYCAGTTPYFIGYNYNSFLSGNGSYTFSFSPAVTAVTLNFSGISDQNGNYEEVRLWVNGQHYAIPEPGTDNMCDDMAILTLQGNIAGCDECATSGWLGTHIEGPISSITVEDTVYLGTPNGAIFSLFICDPSGVGIAEEKLMENGFFSPNPFSSVTRFVTEATIPEFTMYIFSLDGRILKEMKVSKGENVILSNEGLSSGIYFYQFVSEEKIIASGKLIAK